MAYIPLKTVRLFAAEFEKKLKGYTVEKFCHGDDITVYLLDDSLAILVQIVGYKCSLCLNPEQMYGYYRKNPFLEFPKDGETYYHLRIEELTPNTIQFKFNNTKFAKEMEEITGINYLDLCIYFSHYTSMRDEYWRYRTPELEPDANKRINELFPELRLNERCDQWEGEKYYFIVLEMEDSSSEIHRAVAYCLSKPHTYVNKLCQDWIRTGRIAGNSIENGITEREMNSAFNSWSGMKRQKRLEEHLKYFYIEKYFTSKTDAAIYAYDVRKDVLAGKYDNEERSSYLKPVNKWVSEELVYSITKKYYGKKYAVIYQHRPFFLKSSKDGQMSYDVFISEVNVAIEYQGQQHFEPVDFFGGQDAFEDVKKRDAEKAKLSINNGVRLVYVNYWEEISPKLIIDRVGIQP